MSMIPVDDLVKHIQALKTRGESGSVAISAEAFAFIFPVDSPVIDAAILGLADPSMAIPKPWPTEAEMIQKFCEENEVEYFFDRTLDERIFYFRAKSSPDNPGAD